jgi:uncharacterized protein (TIGR02145 family)
MAENLNYASEGSACYDNGSVNCNKYGRLYNWNAAMKACPQSWHLPDDAEWDALIATIGSVYGTSTVGKHLKAKSGWPVFGKISHNGFDTYGFAALPGGEALGGYFNGGGNFGYWWSATAGNSQRASFLYIRSAYEDVSKGDAKDKNNFISIRCLKDTEKYTAKIKAAEAKAKAKADADAKAGAEAIASLSSFTDSRDGKSYKTVKIGEQVWMAENLNYKTDNSQCYDNNEANCNKYGRLYNWKTAKKACPQGWYLPSDDEWKKLANFAGGDEIAGKKLKAKSGGGTDVYGFSALSGGRGAVSWWTATDVGFRDDWAYYRSMNFGGSYDGIIRERGTGTDFLCVRCVKGKEEYSAKKTEKQYTAINAEFTDTRDKKKYKTVKIGEQVWMAENLNYHGSDGYLGLCYDKKPEHCKKYGRLYSWNEAKTACPSGWHLPSDDEWEELIDFAGGDEVAGKKLKAKKGWPEYDCRYTTEDDRGRTTKHDVCTDEFGFAALPGGIGEFGNDFDGGGDGGVFAGFRGGPSERFGGDNEGNYGIWWSATERYSSAYIRSIKSVAPHQRSMLGKSVDGVRRSSDDCYKKDLLSVRCIKDN